MVNGSCLTSGSCLMSGSCLTSGSSLISGELSDSRLTRFDLGRVARAVLHATHVLFRFPCEQPVHATQSFFTFP